MSYLHGLYLDSFHATKRHSYNGYPIYIAIFNSFHEAVYSVGMTTNRFCFMQIISYNSRTIHRIHTKFDARIRLWVSFLCAKCQGDRNTCLHFIAIFISVQKHEEEKMKKKKNFGSLYLGNSWSDFLQIWYVDSPGWRATL